MRSSLAAACYLLARQVTGGEQRDNKKMKKDLWDVLLSLYEKEQAISSLFGDTDFLDEEIDMIWNLLLESLKVPENEIIRERACNLIFEFENGNLSKEKAINQIKKMVTMYG